MMDVFIIVFTDLDGTLLDHNDYSFTAAQPCLDFMRENDIPIIFASSKTSIEIENLCSETNFFHPYIAENGALLCMPENYFLRNKPISSVYKKIMIGLPRVKIDQVLNNLHTSYQFRSFSDLTTDEIVKHTGLSENQALDANQRECTEPILWEDSENNLILFSKQLEKFNMQLLRGGRFHHVMGIHDKATTMSVLLQDFKKHCSKTIISIALGDSPNDYKMLKTANYGVVIPNPDTAEATIDESDKIIYAETAGPQGWNDTLLKLFEELL